MFFDDLLCDVGGRALRKIESASFDREQAEALVEVFDAELDDLATKVDLRSRATKADIATVKADHVACSWASARRVGHTASPVGASTVEGFP